MNQISGRVTEREGSIKNPIFCSEKAMARRRLAASFPARSVQRRVTDPLQVIALCHEEGTRAKWEGGGSLLYLIPEFTTRVSSTSAPRHGACSVAAATSRGRAGLSLVRARVVGVDERWAASGWKRKRTWARWAVCT